MNAGPLRERFRFDARTDVDDGYGNTKSTWNPGATVWARLKNLRGGESVMASRLEGKQPAIVSVRRSTATLAVTTDHRAVDTRTGQTYNIRAVNPSEDRRFIEFLCEAGVADG